MWREFHYNNKSMKPRRQQLRNAATLAEKVLWRRLRKRQLGIRFIRQYSVEGYVIDFFSPEVRLAIEIDGGYHLSPDQQIYDKSRSRYLKAADITEVRFTNDIILYNINDVIDRIKSSVPPLRVRGGEGVLC